MKLNSYVAGCAALRLCVISVAAFAWLVASQSQAIAATQSEALRRACEYLWSKQAEDGGWHSEQYAVLRSGQALTPFVLHTLLSVPESICPRPEGAVERALDFIRRHVDDDGVLGHDDPDIVEYPVYSTAYAIRCFVAYLNQPEVRAARMEMLVCDTADEVLIRRMASFLRKGQFNQDSGFDAEDLAYGGWGFDLAQRPGDPGHMDLAHTRRALEALADAEAVEGDHLFTLLFPRSHRVRALQFLLRVQKNPGTFTAPQQPEATGERTLPTEPEMFDGGFYFSPVVLGANKGRVEEKDGMRYFRSYATSTCDGVLALLAAGVPRGDPRVIAAEEWLRRHEDLSSPQGIPTNQLEPWAEALRFYHYAVRAETYAALEWPGDWRERLAGIVAPQQSRDGSFRNDASPLMKEDDPLLCTALAAIALARCVDANSGPEQR